MADKNWAAHCDTEIVFFETEDEARDWAADQVEVSRREAVDGWNEELTEGIVVMKVVTRATKVNPDVDYRCVNYFLKNVVEE